MHAVVMSDDSRHTYGRKMDMLFHRRGFVRAESFLRKGTLGCIVDIGSSMELRLGASLSLFSLEVIDFLFFRAYREVVFSTLLTSSVTQISGHGESTKHC